MVNSQHLPPLLNLDATEKGQPGYKGPHYINPNQRVNCAITDIPQAPIEKTYKKYSPSFIASPYPTVLILHPADQPNPISSPPLCLTPILIPIPPCPRRPAGRPPRRRQEPTTQTTAVPVSNPYQPQHSKEKGKGTPNKPTTQPTIKTKPLTKSQKTTPPPPAAPPPAVVVATYPPTASPSRPPSSPARGYPPCPRRPCCSGDCS